jgi:hypothetical protein
MTLAIPATGEVIILSMEYAPDGVSWCRLWDNHALGWLVDEGIVALPTADAAPDPNKPAVTGQHAPIPIILGSLAAPAPETPPILSPQWAKYDHPAVFVPDMARLTLHDFLTFLARNNGAARPLGSMIGLSNTLRNGYDVWALDNPTLAFKGEPPPSGPAPSPPVTRSGNRR